MPSGGKAIARPSEAAALREIAGLVQGSATRASGPGGAPFLPASADPDRG